MAVAAARCGVAAAVAAAGDALTAVARGCRDLIAEHEAAHFSLFEAEEMEEALGGEFEEQDVTVQEVSGTLLEQSLSKSGTLYNVSTLIAGPPSSMITLFSLLHVAFRC